MPRRQRPSGELLNRPNTRTTTLLRQGWVTKAARDQAVADADTARSAETTPAARKDQLVVRALIDGVVTKRDVEPSERQRVAIARALANDPLLMLGNEPIGNLDSGNSAKVL